MAPQLPSVCRLTGNSQEEHGKVFSFIFLKQHYTACFNGSGSSRHEKVQKGNFFFN